MDRLRESAAQVQAANDAHAKAVRDALSDLAWMGSQVYRVRESHLTRGCAAAGEVVHIVERWDEETGNLTSEAHHEEVCPERWCGLVGEQRFVPYRRRGQRIGFTFRGQCVVLMVADGHLIVSPDISSPITPKNGTTS